MSDKRKNNGGPRKGAGRKPKAEEDKIVQKLSPLEPLAYAALKSGLEQKDGFYVKLYYSYYWGMPKQQHEIGGKDGDPIIVNVIAP